MNKAILTAVALLFAGATLAGSQDYKELPGVKEFSGQMIVRPKQIDDLLGQGVSIKQAMLLAQQAQQRLTPMTAEYVVEVDEYIINVPDGSNENLLASQLMGTGLFEYAHPNWILYPLLTPNDPRYGSQWHHPKIRSNIAWDYIQGNPSVTLAVCDTGVRKTHEDLTGRWVNGYNSASGQAEANGGQVNDVNGHGTHVAGCAAASGNNGKGVAGVAWTVKIMPIRVTNDAGGGASLSALTNGARWAVDNGAKPISVSYSGVDSSSIQTTGNYIKGKGGLLLWAAGNDNRNLTGFDHADVIVVGASNSSDGKASFSAYGRGVDVFSPGTGIWSSTRTSDTSYEAWDGTSMATPVANGACALIWSMNPALTPNQVETILFNSCKDLGNAGNDDYWGWGRIDVGKAIESMGPLPPTANNDAYNANEGQTLNIAAPGVLGNDTDPNGQTLTAVLDTNVTNGSLTLNANGSFSYTPNPGFFGVDTFKYKAKDTDNMLSAAATVTITVVQKTFDSLIEFYTVEKGFTNNDPVTDIHAVDGITLDVLNQKNPGTLGQPEADLKYYAFSQFNQNVSKITVSVNSKVTRPQALLKIFAQRQDGSGIWDQIGSGTVTTGGTTVTASTTNTALYINADTTIGVRTQYFPSGPGAGFNWTIKIDQVRVQLTQP
ncbi:MAG: hypothetical protein HONBIEJF_02994 [Fimbriimonadaceae bacterium]|nr:hypothetical protein [Fimbriimonadaceae bacterium]